MVSIVILGILLNFSSVGLLVRPRPFPTLGLLPQFCEEADPLQ